MKAVTRHTYGYRRRREERAEAVPDLFLHHVLNPEDNQHRQGEAQQPVQCRFAEHHAVDVAASCPIAAVSGDALGAVHHARDDQQDVVQYRYRQHQYGEGEEDDIHDAVVIR